MAVNMNAVSVLPAIAVTPVAPLIEGAAAAVLNATTSAAFATSAYYNFGSSLTGRYGMRCNLASPLNFSGYDFVTFAANSQQFDPGSALDSVANGGIRIYFIDGAGNYSGFNIGGYLPLYSTDTAAANGFFMQYNSVNLIYSIAMARTPDVAGGVLNWSNIVAIEVTTKTISASRKDFHISRLAKRSAPIVTGSETLAGLSSAAASVVNGTTGDPFLLKAAAMYLGAAAQTNFNIRLGLTIGDGLAATSFIESNFAIGFETLYEYSPAAKSHGPWVQLDNAKTRAFKVNQSASDVLNLADGSIASAGGWQWELSGSGVATCTRMQFWRFNGFRAAHGDYIDCAWNDADTPVEVTAATVISGGLIRGAKATGLKVLGAAGVYSNLDLSIDSLVGTYDIELGAGGAGTYELPHITVPAGRTLRVRNNSASNAIVVILPPGTVYSATTAGGSITVVSAGTKLTITDLPLGCDAVVLTAGTSTVLAQADELPGATFVFEYTGAPVVDIGIFKPGYKPRYLRNLQLATSDSAIPVSLEIDRSYLP